MPKLNLVGRTILDLRHPQDFTISLQDQVAEVFFLPQRTAPYDQVFR